MRIDDVIVGARFRKDLGDLAALAKSISEIGLLHPIVVTPDNQLIAGQRRLEACRLLGWEMIPATVVDIDNIVRGEHDENLVRKGLLPTEAVAIGEALKERKAAEARERQRAAGISNLPTVSGGNFPPLTDTGKTRDKVGEAVGLSGKTYEKAVAVVEAAKAEPEKFADLPTLMDERSVEAAYKELARRERENTEREKRKQAASRAVIRQADAVDFLRSLPEQSADLLLTDPPYMTDIDGDVYEFASGWLPLALSRVKQSGRAYIFIGAYPRELHAYLGVALAQPFTLANVLVWHYPNTLGPQPRMQYKQNWQAVLYLYGPDAGPLDAPIMTEATTVHTLATAASGEGKSYDTWQKPIELGRRFVLQATKPGELVIDPFAGTGTFLLAASDLGRQSLGCDRDAAKIAIAVQRGCTSHAR